MSRNEFDYTRLYEVLSACIDICDETTGTHDIFRVVERDLCRSIKSRGILQERKAKYLYHNNSPSNLDFLTKTIQIIHNHLDENGAMICETRKGKRPVTNNERLAKAFREDLGYSWIEKHHIRIAKRVKTSIRSRS